MKRRMSAVAEERRSSLSINEQRSSVAVAEPTAASNPESDVVETPLPKLPLLPILLVLLCEAFMAESLSAYVGYTTARVLAIAAAPFWLPCLISKYMMVDLGMAENKDKSGFWAGLLSSSFYMMQFFSSFLWGAMSDRFGRRPVLLIGCAGSMVTSLMFGFSRSYTLAIVSRSLIGLLNGNIGAVKTFLAETTDNTNRVRAFGLVGLMWGVGGVAGSTAGGFSVRLAIKYPRSFSQKGFFGKFPYAAPNLMAAMMLLVSFVLSFFLLKEPPKGKRGYRRASLVGDQELDILPTGSIYDTESSQLHTQSSFGSPSPTIEPGIRFSSLRERCGRVLDLSLVKEVFRNRAAVTSFSLYGLIGFAYTIFGTVFPLMLIAPSIGMNFSTDDIGFNNGVGGVAAIIIQLIIYTPLANRLGLRRMINLGLLIGIPLFIIFPTLKYLTPPYASLQRWNLEILVYSLYCLHTFASESLFSAVMTMICNAVPNRQLGCTNGISQSLVGLLRGIGPFAGASLFQWTLSPNHTFPVNHYLVFVLLAVCLLVVGAINILLTPESLDEPYVEVSR